MVLRDDARKAMLRVAAGLDPATEFTTPANYELALLDQSGNEVSTSGTGYARRTITSTAFWEVVTGGLGSPEMRNLTTVRWPASGTASGTWGNIRWVAIYEPGDATPIMTFDRGSGNEEPVNAGGHYQVDPGDLVLIDTL